MTATAVVFSITRHSRRQTTSFSPSSAFFFYNRHKTHKKAFWLLWRAQRHYQAIFRCSVAMLSLMSFPLFPQFKSGYAGDARHSLETFLAFGLFL